MTAPVIERFHIQGSRHPRPAAERVVYADGAGAGERRPGVDVELSHWVPNTTDEGYKADTSTGICLRYMARPGRDDVELVVNNHADVDGILSLYTLLHPERALANAAVLVGAASMRDLMAWADRPAFRLAQELLLMLSGPDRPADAGDCYRRAFDIADGVLDGTLPEAQGVAAGWAAVERGRERLEREVDARQIGDRLVSFVYPPSASRDLDAALAVPILNDVVDDSVWLWPQVRNAEHGEQIQLVSVPHRGQWFHDVWLPGYCWAETPGRWPVPGLVSSGDSNVWLVEHEPLRQAVRDLAAADGSAGTWTSAAELTPFTTMPGRRFPVVASHVDPHGRPTPSDLAPDQVAGILARAW